MFAKDFRKWARESLRGKWGTAIAVCLVASLLGGGFNFASGLFSGEEPVGMVSFGPAMITMTVASVLIALVIGGAMALGQTLYFTNLVSRRPAQFADLFSRFKVWYKGFWMKVVVSFFTTLWSMLGAFPAILLCAWWFMGHTPEYEGMVILAGFVLLASFPGWIAYYRYAMTPYVLAEFPDLSVMDALRESKRLMKGNKWRMFCLQLSFWGWIVLSVFTFGIGYIWLFPYMSAANAAFYMDVTGRAGIRYGQPTE